MKESIRSLNDISGTSTTDKAGNQMGYEGRGHNQRITREMTDTLDWSL